MLEQIDLTRKAILARAFRGELGTNDPSDESAVELLKKNTTKYYIKFVVFTHLTIHVV